MLVPEPDNPHDENAIMVVIDTGLVGYLGREDAAAHLPGLQRLMRQHRTHIGLSGVIVGGGQRADGPGMLGVFLDHDPTDFGISRHLATHIGELRTGLSEAIQTDLEDDSYDLSWLSALSGTKSPADIVTLRKLLEAENDPLLAPGPEATSRPDPSGTGSGARRLERPKKRSFACVLAD